MNLIYLHGFQSSALSIKGQMLKRYCDESFEKSRHIHVHLPDLNQPPLLALHQVSELIGQLGPENTALLGSSLGGFYALQLALIRPCSRGRCFEHCFHISRCLMP